MQVLVTGAAGFIGHHVSTRLLERGEQVIGVDNLNTFYDVRLKHARLETLHAQKNFVFHELDVSEREAVLPLAKQYPQVEAVVHLAARAGVLQSLRDPYSYVQDIVMSQVVMLEYARCLESLRHFVYASTSAVYGANPEMPFSETQRVDLPMSVYAATKRGAELLTHTYSHVYRIPTTGLRFFTVYGPWGRPDMAAFLFADAILAGNSLPVFNHGKMQRDFTFISDIGSGVLAAIDRPPSDTGEPPHRVYNLGNHRSEALGDLIGALERALGRKANLNLLPMQPGDVPNTLADISRSQRELGFEPRVSLEEGISSFVEWFVEFRKRHPEIGRTQSQAA